MQDIIKAIGKNPQEAALLLKTSFKYFIRVFHYYTKREEFIFKPFHLTLIKKFEDLVFGNAEKQNLAISISPRTGKSLLTKYFIAWTYAVNKNSNNIYTSYSDKLIQKFSGEIKDLIDSELYKRLFGIILKQDTHSKALWNIENGGGLMASPLGGSITGFGAGSIGDDYAGAILIDDPLKADDAKSEVARQNCIDFYTDTLKSRREQTDRTPMIVIMQRLHKEDLVGYLMENEPEDWDFVKLPALDDEGNSIFPEKLSVPYLEKIRTIHPYLFYAQYQQEPIIAGGGVIKTEWFKYYPLMKYNYVRCFICADTAQKVKEANDYSVFIVAGITDFGKLHVLDLVRGKWEYPDLKRQAIALWDRWNTPETPLSGFYVEDKASGTGMIQDFGANTGIPVIPLVADKDKLTRTEAVLGHIEAGNVLLPCSDTYSFVPAILSECAAFTRDDSHTHDDIVDALVYAIMVGLSKFNVSILDVLD